MELTILMPCLNEEKTIEECIKLANEFMTKNDISGEVLIADNNSTDNSALLAKAVGARVISVEEQGYGSALIAGINSAKGKYTIMGDCDMSYDFKHLENFIDELRNGNDFVIGNRFAQHMENGAMPISHFFGVKFLSLLGRLVYKTKVTDFHCGLRGFNTEIARSLNFKCTGMEFATEMIGKFSRANCKIAEVPIVLHKDKRECKPHLKTVDDGVRHLELIIQDAFK